MKRIRRITRQIMVLGFAVGLLPAPTMAQTPNPEELKTLNTAVGKAIDAHDVGGIVGYMAPDAVFDFVLAPAPLTGTNDIAGFFAGLFHGFPDYVTIGEQVWVSSNAVVTAHTTDGHLQNEWMGLPPTGKDTNGPPHVHLDILGIPGRAMGSDPYY